ncbi:YjeF_N domain-containing protein [Histoplasma capsulatum G186AR]|uniref:Enhancer of mRNA-decapping protein 3 n=2 Tax=Ajellomyces capsulatus TaxID=5037 RepID=C0NFA9_AJECG|nr:YjeF_N domain-containing protein [Histoplasma capsulatum G186AR]EEH09930.1 YjeF_N domain-containing protein [Histoplasma capsulatum G186AR]KAG5298953.1 YjeF_N domain-containing protein [Histoplasma capsulatum]QSS73053.1 YjeF_N domain-containing protein [Histoplasma capsulatum G186AR]
MAADFVGYTVLVTLKSPPDSQVQGVVADVAGQRLTLQHATLLWSGQHIPLYHIDAPGIADLELSSHQIPNPPAAANYGTTAQPSFHNGGTLPPSQRPSQLPQRRQENAVETVSIESRPQAFVDPAILSFQKPSKNSSISTTNIHLNTGKRDATSPVMIADSESSARSGAKSMVPTAITPTGPKQAAVDDATATLSEPFNNLSFNEGSTEDQGTQVEQAESSIPEGRRGAGPLEAPLKYTGKRSRRGGRNKMNKDAAVQSSGVDAITENPTATTGSSRPPVPGKGWRKTAFVEPARDPSPQKLNNGRARRSKVRSKKSYAEDPSGWATEDATDIQEMGDFDFASNLSKFDKRRVFDEIRNDDTTTGEERLVSFNRRVQRPGTNDGRNLHYTENVLDDNPSNDKWNSEAGETDDDEASEERFSSGRNSARARSRVSVSARAQSRKGSTILGSTLVSSQISSLSRGQMTGSRTESPQPHKSSPLIGSGSSSTGSLLLAATKRPCPCVGPLQMIEIEQLAITELGLGEDIITENAGRGIAEAAVFQVSKLAISSTILVLAGNHRTGSRAICAARHFRNRGYRVTLCVLGLDREDEFMDGVRKQIDIFKKVTGRVMRWEEISTRLTSGDYVPDLVIDALFGVHIAFDDLRTDDQATAFEMISWANRNNVEILSVDVPSGLSAVSGEATLVQGSRLSVNSKFIVCLGAPKTGLVHALGSGEGLAWNITVADIGISQVVWKKYGSRRRHGVDFGNQWIVPLRFQTPTP